MPCFIAFGHYNCTDQADEQMNHKSTVFMLWEWFVSAWSTTIRLY